MSLRKVHQIVRYPSSRHFGHAGLPMQASEVTSCLGWKASWPRQADGHPLGLLLGRASLFPQLLLGNALRLLLGGPICFLLLPRLLPLRANLTN